MCQANAFYFLFSFKYKKIIVYHIYNIYKYVYVICVCVLYNHIGVQSRAKSYKICPRGVGGWLWLLFTFDRKKDRDRWRKGREKRKGNEEKNKKNPRQGTRFSEDDYVFRFPFFFSLFFLVSSFRYYPLARNSMTFTYYDSSPITKDHIYHGARSFEITDHDTKLQWLITIRLQEVLERRWTIIYLSFISSSLFFFFFDLSIKSYFHSGVAFLFNNLTRTSLPF